jgi:hypothetical protein
MLQTCLTEQEKCAAIPSLSVHGLLLSVLTSISSSGITYYEKNFSFCQDKSNKEQNPTKQGL